MPKREGKKVVTKCSCGYTSDDVKHATLNEKVKKDDSRMDVVDTAHDLKSMPKMKAECPKCGNQEAAFWEVQTRAADEPATKFMKCTKCKHIWRDYN